MKKSYKINEDFVNSRLDRWIKRNICRIPQSLIEKNLRKGKIKVNNKKKNSSYKLQLNDEVLLYNFNFQTREIAKRIDYYHPTRTEVSLTKGIFIEDNKNFVVINKPSGIAVQSGTKSKKNILDILRKTEEFKESSPYSVHRLDKETSGIMIVAKNRNYAQLFTSLFRIRKIHKTYLAIIKGELSEKKGTFIDDLFYYEGKKKVIHRAKSSFKVIDSKNNYSLIKLNPETGRKHQLRKQLMIRGHSIIGDIKYNLNNKHLKKNANLMLHASEISFKINNIKYKFSAELPIYFSNFIKEKYLKIY